jgi:drug/metabolite transporter (DMT)-like permease
MSAILLGILAGFLFGALAVLVRRALGKVPDAVAGSVIITATGALLTTAVAIATGVGGDLLDWRVGLTFLLVGAFVPGASQILFVVAVGDIGPSRAAVWIGTAPLVAAIIAIGFRDEPFSALLAAGTVLIVVGSASLAWERTRPASYRRRGAFLAVLCAVLFAMRDNAVRIANVASEMDPRAATAYALVGAALATFSYAAVTRRERLGVDLRRTVRAFIPPGIGLAAAYTALVAGLEVGGVTVIAPLNAIQSLWAVLIAWVFLRATDKVGPRLFLAGGLVVAGGILIGVTR